MQDLHQPEHSDEEEAFFFESPEKYDPHVKTEVLSPKTPQLDKVLRNANGPQRFHLEPIKRMPQTPQPRRDKLANQIMRENFDYNVPTAQTPKKARDTSFNDFSPKNLNDEFDFINQPANLKFLKMPKAIEDEFFGL